MRRRSGIAAAAALAVAAAPASAAPPPIAASLVRPGEGDAAGASRLRIRVAARAGLEAAGFALEPLDVADARPIAAARAVPFARGEQPMALVVLVEGNGRWMGNESYVAGDEPGATIYQGAHRGLGPAIAQLAAAGPPGSRAALVVYGDGGGVVRRPMGDAAAMAESALGAQADYQDQLARPLLVGLVTATRILAAEPGHRRVLVVFGDGEDDRAEIDVELGRAIADLRALEVESFAVHYAPVADGRLDGVRAMERLGYARAYQAASRDGFGAFAGDVVEHLGARYDVDFPADGFALDGAVHRFALSIEGQGATAIDVALPWSPPPAARGRRRWRSAAAVGGAVALAAALAVALGWRRRRRRFAAAPRAASRTAMLGADGAPEAMPVVGWLVPLEGAARYRTFELAAGATRLGSGGASRVVLDDEFVSAEHAEIVASPTGFVLRDLGSTNGSFRRVGGSLERVEVHELYDNDVFRIGRTDVAFKSIN